MIEVVLSSIFYPLSMNTYFIRALRRRPDVHLTLVGPTTGNWIPWMGGMTLPAKYAVTPDIPIDFPVQEPWKAQPYNPDVIGAVLGFEPDLWLQIDSGFHAARRPAAKSVATVAVDPHVLKYDLPRSYSDKFFNMQTPYFEEGDYWLPYACDPEWHSPLPDDRVQDIDGCLIGILYDKRIALKDRLTGLGYKIRMETGLIGPECREAYSHSKVGLDWSSLLDLNARVFELMGMGLCPILNRVPDLKPLFQEEMHYLGYDTLEEAKDQFIRAMNDEALRTRIGKAASHQVHAFHTWPQRIEQIFEVCLNG